MNAAREGHSVKQPALRATERGEKMPSDRHGRLPSVTNFNDHQYPLPVVIFRKAFDVPAPTTSVVNEVIAIVFAKIAKHGHPIWGKS